MVLEVACDFWKPGKSLGRSAAAFILATGDTVASEKDDKMSETMINDKNLPNPHLFEPLFYSRA